MPAIRCVLFEIAAPVRSLKPPAYGEGGAETRRGRYKRDRIYIKHMSKYTYMHYALSSMSTLLSYDARLEIDRINLSLREKMYKVEMIEDIDCVERDEDDDINKAPPRRFVIRLARRYVRNGIVDKAMQVMIEDKIKLSAGVLTCDLVTWGSKQALGFDDWTDMKEKFVALMIHLRVYCAACAGFQLVLDATDRIEREPIGEYRQFSCIRDKYVSDFNVVLLLNASKSKFMNKDVAINEGLNPLQKTTKNALVKFARSMIGRELQRYQRPSAVPLSSNMYIVAL